MKYKQNEKILQLTETTLFVGIDITKNKHKHERTKRFLNQFL